MGVREDAARKYLSEQRRLDIKDAGASMREQFGECPRYDGHFDFPSFVAGIFVAIWAVGLISFLVR